MLVVLAAATITAILVQVAVQAAGGQKRRLAYELALEQANVIERRVANVLAQDPLEVFASVLADEVPRVCVGDEATYPSALGSGSAWPASCGALWSYEGTANLAKGARVFPPSPSDPTWRVEVFAEVGSERVGFTRTFLVGGRDRPMLYSGGALDLASLAFVPVVDAPVYANGDVTLGSSTVADGVLVASESSVLDPGSSLAAASGGAGSGADIDVRAAHPSPLPSSMLVSSLNELNRVACRDASPARVVLAASTVSTGLCLRAGASLVDETGATKTFPASGAYVAVLVVPESAGRLRVFTRGDVPAAWPGLLAEWTELGVFPLPAHGLVATDALTVLGHCDESAGVCRDWDGDSVPGSRVDSSFTLLVGSASSPADLYVGGPLRAGTGRVGAVVGGVVRFPLEATPSGVALPVDLSVAALGRPGSVSVASSGSGSRPSLAWTGGLLLADFSADLSGFSSVSFTVPSESALVPPFLPSPGLLARSEHARRLPAADLDALFALGEASGMGVPSAPGLLDLAESDATMALTWSVPVSDGGVGITDYVVEYRKSSASSWSVFADPVSASLTSTVTGLENEVEYQFRVAAVNGVGRGPFSGVLAATPFVLPFAPSGLAVSPVSPSSLSLSWSAVSNTAISGYSVYRQNPLSGVFEVVGTSATTSFLDAGLTAGTSYSYKVAAFTVLGSGILSGGVSSSTPVQVPATPTVTGSLRGSLSVTLQFSSSTSSSSPVQGFRFYVDGSEVASSSDASLTSYVFTGLTAGSSPEFAVAAFNTTGTSPAAAAVVTVIDTPGVPLSVALVPETDVPGSLVLSWSPPTGIAAEGFFVYRLNDLSGVYEVVASTASTSFTDSVLDAGTEYSYRVSAFVSTLEGGLSGVVSAVAIDVPLTVLILGTTLESGAIRLGFVEDALAGRPVEGFRLYLDGVEVADVAATASEYLFGSLVEGFTYELGVSAYNAAGEGLPDAVLATAYDTPAQVTGLLVDAVAGSGSSLSLAWDEPTGAYDGFFVERRTLPSGTFQVVATTSTASYVSTGLVPGTSYAYRVSAFNPLSSGPVSVAVSATPDTPPGAPSVSSVTAGDQQLSVAFTAGSNSGSSVTIYEYSTDGGSTWRARASGTTASPLVVTTISGVANTALVNGVSYQVRLRAVNAAGSGVASSSTSATPSAP